jgi:hypothetical protein
VVLAGIGFLRHRARFRNYLPAVLAVSFLAIELNGVFLKESPDGLYVRMLAWLPSRTSSTMTAFALCALASYARFERLGSKREVPPSATDLPATRKSAEAIAQPPVPWIWLLASYVFVALALGCYEQAAMLPMILLIVGGAMHAMGYRVRWYWHMPFWLILAGYVTLRSAVLPMGLSEYQQQQSRSGLTVVLSILQYVFPSLTGATFWWAALSLGLAVLLTGFFYSFLWRVAGNAVLYYEAFRRSNLSIAMWLASLFAFAPMAFLKPFAHYHYWPMALRSLFVVALVGVVWELAVSAASPRGLQAPARPSPAPGSLPRPSG